MKSLTLAALVLLTATYARPQNGNPQGLTPQSNQTDNPITAQTRKAFETVSTNLVKAAREMPETAYGSKPIQNVRTFGELIAHITDVQETLCANIDGHPVKNATRPLSKENLIKDLTQSQADCQIAFAELSAENASKPVQSPEGRVTHVVALMYIITHASEEYGQLSVYLRLNHLQPPTSDEPKSGSAGKASS